MLNNNKLEDYGLFIANINLILDFWIKVKNSKLS